MQCGPPMAGVQGHGCNYTFRRSGGRIDLPDLVTRGTNLT